MGRQFDIGYAMGLLVGESHFGTERTKAGRPIPKLDVKLQFEDPEPLQFLCKLFGGKIFGPYLHGGRHYRIWRLNGKGLSKILPLLNRYLPVSRKRRQFEKWVQTHKFEGIALQLQMEMLYVEHNRITKKKKKIESELLKFVV